MNRQLSWTKAAVLGLCAGAMMAGSPANANDFFTSLFQGILGGQPSRAMRSPSLPFADPTPNYGSSSSLPRVATAGATAYCVRTCDGRYFPLTATGGQSKAETCNSLCPASETKVVYGNGIDNAATENGKPYAALPNAFRYRTELVNGCTCNGKTSGGLAQIDVQNDPTLKKGDLVATADGSLVASGNGLDAKRAANYTPVAKGRRLNLQSIPIVAAE